MYMGKNKRHFHKENSGERTGKAHNKMEDNKVENPEEAVQPQDEVVVDAVNSTPAEDAAAEEAVAAGADEPMTEEEKLRKEIDSLKAQLEKEKKEYMFLMADFDNYRKHTLKDKSELIKNAGENVFRGLLPIVDDMERAIKHGENSDDPKALHDGMVLIFKKLKDYMEKNGVKPMVTNGEAFDADRHEAISVVPVPDEAQKGKILDTVNTGYTINDKVLRHAKVVVGQ